MRTKAVKIDEPDVSNRVLNSAHIFTRLVPGASVIKQPTVSQPAQTVRTKICIMIPTMTQKVAMIANMYLKVCTQRKMNETNE